MSAGRSTHRFVVPQLIAAWTWVLLGTNKMAAVLKLKIWWFFLCVCTHLSSRPLTEGTAVDTLGW